MQAVASATSARNRQISKEVADAQQAYVKSWVAARDADRDERLRILARIDRRVPAICAESGGSGDAQDSGLGGADAALTSGEAADALSAGVELEGVLRLCQSELRQCAGLR